VTTHDLLHRGWAVLVPPTDHRQYMSFSLDVHSGTANCRLAVDRQGARHVLVPVEHDETLGTQPGSALTIEQRRLVFGGDEHAYVDVGCLRSDLYYEFDSVVADIVDAVRDAADARRATLEVVARWRRLFRTAAVKGMDLGARRGLFAELCCFQRFATGWPDLGIDSWRGPLREPHDFELPSACVEVKATGAISESIRIHGLEQLDLHGGRPLYLGVLTVAEDPDGRSIPDLVEELVSVTNDRAGLAGRLAAAGWSNDDPSRDTRYSLGPLSVVPVTAEVPRIVKSSLVAGSPAEGVTRVEYSIDRDALASHVVGASLDQLLAVVQA
jgi:hypothetical protein